MSEGLARYMNFENIQTVDTKIIFQDASKCYRIGIEGQTGLFFNFLYLYSLS
jgi:hypothetical protein